MMVSLGNIWMALFQDLFMDMVLTHWVLMQVILIYKEIKICCTAILESEKPKMKE